MSEQKIRQIVQEEIFKAFKQYEDSIYCAAYTAEDGVCYCNSTIRQQLAPIKDLLQKLKLNE